MASRQLSAKKPKDLGHTLRTLLSYLGRHKLLFLAVAVLVALSALANLLGTYMVKPLVNRYIVPGDFSGLLFGVLFYCRHLPRRSALFLWLQPDHGKGSAEDYL